MKLFFFVFAILLVAGAEAQVQGEATYKTAMGVKISSGVAFSYKTFVTSKNAFEAQTAFFKQGIRLVGLYEFHYYAFDKAPGLAWYFGPGAHIGYWKKNYRDKYNSTVDLGVDGVIGLDYRIPNAPINISLDWQPSFSVLGNAGLSPQYGGIAIRYVFQ